MTMTHDGVAWCSLLFALDDLDIQALNVRFVSHLINIGVFEYGMTPYVI